MISTHLLEQLKQMSTSDRLVVIEETARLIRDDIRASAGALRMRRSERMRAAAERLKDV